MWDCGGQRGVDVRRRECLRAMSLEKHRGGRQSGIMKRRRDERRRRELGDRRELEKIWTGVRREAQKRAVEEEMKLKVRYIEGEKSRANG